MLTSLESNTYSSSQGDAKASGPVVKLPARHSKSDGKGPSVMGYSVSYIQNTVTEALRDSMAGRVQDCVEFAS